MIVFFPPSTHAHKHRHLPAPARIWAAQWALVRAVAIFFGLVASRAIHPDSRFPLTVGLSLPLPLPLPLLALALVLALLVDGADEADEADDDAAAATRFGVDTRVFQGGQPRGRSSLAIRSSHHPTPTRSRWRTRRHRGVGFRESVGRGQWRELNGSGFGWIENCENGARLLGDAILNCFRCYL